MDPIEKARAAMGSVERVVSGLPGIKGYKEKEMRREADKKLRVSLARRLESRRRKLTGLQGDLLTAGGLLWMDDIERVVGRLQLLIDRVKTASYGYAPLFDLEKVKETELDKLVQFDQALFDQLPTLDEAIGGIQQAVQSNEHIKEAIQALGNLLAEMNDTFSRRDEAIRGGE